LLPGEQGYAAFRRIFGDEYIQPDGHIDREMLKKSVFEEEAVKAALENILHPLVKQQVSFRIAECEATAKSLVAEVPLLFETGWQDVFDLNVVVYVPPSTCLTRVMARDTMSVAEIDKILASQMPLDRKMELADFVIDNSGTFVSTVQQIGWLARKLTGRQSREEKRKQ
ncbi:MAG: dephospho-CoA kinase, partial [Desulforhopalus sp.]